MRVTKKIAEIAARKAWGKTAYSHYDPHPDLATWEKCTVGVKEVRPPLGLVRVVKGSGETFEEACADAGLDVEEYLL